MSKFSGISGASSFPTITKFINVEMHTILWLKTKSFSTSMAMGRVKSFVTGKSGARKADSDLIRNKRKSLKIG